MSSLFAIRPFTLIPFVLGGGFLETKIFGCGEMKTYNDDDDLGFRGVTVTPFT